MIKEFKDHKLAYLVLILAIIILVISFLAVWPNRFLQRIIILSLSLFYFLWGVLTHFKTKKINQKIIIEYLSISLIAGLLLFLITL